MHMVGADGRGHMVASQVHECLGLGSSKISGHQYICMSVTGSDGKSPSS